ncbi:hypothetical protein P6709_15520 [Jeotgalibacillus sp. ET6]|uniref:hypothetical protein n=1 Tax=Jeotgalibacillus sp. ET6 TaxID=3037260 RepID=UPI002418596F|nr:hypothetical protein [Jeotgalibacillus sp. ET6]MDG5473162.1 hypothetical protein [Jeotgalibacillus sp. ET6]
MISIKRTILIASLVLFIVAIVGMNIGFFLPLFFLALIGGTTGIISIKEESKAEGYLMASLSGVLLAVSVLGMII